MASRPSTSVHPEDFRGWSSVSLSSSVNLATLGEACQFKLKSCKCRHISPCQDQNSKGQLIWSEVSEEELSLHIWLDWEHSLTGESWELFLCSSPKTCLRAFKYADCLDIQRLCMKCNNNNNNNDNNNNNNNNNNNTLLCSHLEGLMVTIGNWQQ